jgi:hypothetical protein
MAAVGIEALLLDQIDPGCVLGIPAEHQFDDLGAALSPGGYLLGDLRGDPCRPFKVIARIHVPGEDAPSVPCVRYLAALGPVIVDMRLPPQKF